MADDAPLPLNLQAILYASGEMSEAERNAFEALLSTDPTAQEALVHAVQLQLLVEGKSLEPAREYRRTVRQLLLPRRWIWPVSRSWIAACATLVGLLVLFTSQSDSPTLGEYPLNRLEDPFLDDYLTDTDLVQQDDDTYVLDLGSLEEEKELPRFEPSQRVRNLDLIRKAKLQSKPTALHPSKRVLFPTGRKTP